MLAAGNVLSGVVRAIPDFILDSRFDRVRPPNDDQSEKAKAKRVPTKPFVPAVEANRNDRINCITLRMSGIFKTFCVGKK